MPLTNQAVDGHRFLAEMYEDGYYPDELVARIEKILREGAAEIERTRPADLPALYLLSRIPTERINDLEQAFLDQDSELETVARDCIAQDFGFVAEAYGFVDADLEELVAYREW